MSCLKDTEHKLSDMAARECTKDHSQQPCCWSLSLVSTVSGSVPTAQETELGLCMCVPREFDYEPPTPVIGSSRLMGRGKVAHCGSKNTCDYRHDTGQSHSVPSSRHKMFATVAAKC